MITLGWFTLNRALTVCDLSSDFSLLHFSFASPAFLVLNLGPFRFDPERKEWGQQAN